LTQKSLNIIIETLSEKYPLQKKKQKTSVLDVLIATKLSQNTTDKSSYIAFKNLKNKFGNWDNVSDAKLFEIKSAIRICGLANTKALHIREMLRQMKKKYGSLNLEFLKKYSDEKIYDALSEYKGIGVKTISCVLGFALGRNAFPVDTHIHRILNRTGIVNTKTPEGTFKAAKNMIPDNKKMTFHTGLIKFGREICRAKTPLCNICYIEKHCEYNKKTGLSNKIPLSNNFIILENI